MCSDDAGYEHMDEQGFVALESTDHGQDEQEEDEDVPSEIVKCPFLMANIREKSTMFQPDATASRVSWLVQLREVAAERRESTRKQVKISSVFFFLRKTFWRYINFFFNFTIF